MVALVRDPLSWKQMRPQAGACADRGKGVEPVKGDVKTLGVGRRAQNVKAPRPSAPEAEGRRARRRPQSQLGRD